VGSEEQAVIVPGPSSGALFVVLAGRRHRYQQTLNWQSRGRIKKSKASAVGSYLIRKNNPLKTSVIELSRAVKTMAPALPITASHIQGG
jgi:hypothetical protein